MNKWPAKRTEQTITKGRDDRFAWRIFKQVPKRSLDLLKIYENSGQIANPGVIACTETRNDLPLKAAAMWLSLELVFASWDVIFFSIRVIDRWKLDCGASFTKELGHLMFLHNIKGL